MTTVDEIRRVARDLSTFNLHGPQHVDENFVECVRVVYLWSTTSKRRWARFARGDLYGMRHHCEYETDCGLTDKAFAIGAHLAGWHLRPDWTRPNVLRFQRAQAEA